MINSRLCLNNHNGIHGYSIKHLPLPKVFEDRKLQKEIPVFLKAVYRAQPGEELKLHGISSDMRSEFILLLQYFYTEKFLEPLTGL